MIKNPAPSTEPSSDARPPRMMMVMNWMERKKLNSWGSRNPTRNALNAPARPVYRALIAKAIVLYCARLPPWPRRPFRSRESRERPAGCAPGSGAREDQHDDGHGEDEVILSIVGIKPYAPERHRAGRTCPPIRG